MIKNIAIVVGIWLLGWGCIAHAATIVRSVRFEGNDVTQERFLRENIFLAEGDVFDEISLSESLQALMDTGLFKRVSYYLASDEPEAEHASDSYVDVVIKIKEKHYIFLLPRYRLKDGENHVGLQLRWDNLHGLNHRVRAIIENRGETLGIAEERLQFDYFYPNVKGRSFSVDLLMRTTNGVNDSIVGEEVNRIDDDVGVIVQRWLNEDRKNIGWYFRAGWLFRQRTNDMLDSAQADETLDAMILQPGFGFSEVHEYGYNRGGKEYGYDMEFAHRVLYGDTDFIVHRLHYRSYYRFASAPLDNLNVQTILGLAPHKVMDDLAFSLGADDLRGYESGRFEGNNMLQINMEYQTAMERRPRLRYVAFLDLGNAWQEREDIFRDGLHAGVGVGVRWKIPAFVKLDLRVDVGYGISDETYKTTAGTHYNF